MMSKFFRNKSDSVSYALRGSEKPGCLLFAEGDAEAYYLDSWLNKLGKDAKDIAVVCFKGGSKLGNLFRALSEEENFSNVKRFGFFLDAEQNKATHMAASICSVLQKHEIIFPQTHLKAGVLHEMNGYRVAICVSPDNIEKGCIEDIVINEINSSQLSASIKGLADSAGIILHAPVSSKALVQAYLGLLQPGLCGTGRGFDTGKLDVLHDAYRIVRETISPLLN